MFVPEQNLKQLQLITLCLDNNRKAQKELYEKFGPSMKTVCLRYLYNKSLAEEVMNNGFLKVFAKLKSFENKGSFEGWIKRIMVNECLDENRRKNWETDTDELKDWQGSEPAETDSNEGLIFLKRVISSLPAGLRVVFNLIEIDGFTHKEVAEQLQITESASRSQLTKAKQLLRQKLETIKL